jgi:hypothetical protein
MQRKELIARAINVYQLHHKISHSILDKLNQVAEDDLPKKIQALAENPDVNKDPLLKYLIKVLCVCVDQIPENYSKKLSELKVEGARILTPAAASWRFSFIGAGSAPEISADLKTAYDSFHELVMNYIKQIKPTDAKQAVTDKLESLIADEYVSLLSPRSLKRIQDTNTSLSDELKTKATELQDKERKLDELKGQLIEKDRLLDEMKRAYSSHSSELLLRMTEIMRLDSTLKNHFIFLSHLYSKSEAHTEKLAQLKKVHDRLAGLFLRILDAQDASASDAKVELPDEAFRAEVATLYSQEMPIRTAGMFSRMHTPTATNTYSPARNFYKLAKQILVHLEDSHYAELLALIKSTPKPMFTMYLAIIKMQQSVPDTPALGLLNMRKGMASA